MTRTTLKSTALIAAAFTAAIALAPTNAEAGKTGYFVGGIAAGVGGLLLLDAVSRSNRYYDRSNHNPRGYYAPRYYYQPARACRSTRSALRKLRRNHGFHSFHNVRYRTNSIKLNAWKYGSLYKLKATRCSGNLIWSRAI